MHTEMERAREKNAIVIEECTYALASVTGHGDGRTLTGPRSMSSSLIDRVSRYSKVASLIKCRPESRINGFLLIVARPICPGSTRTIEMGPLLMCASVVTLREPIGSRAASLM